MKNVARLKWFWRSNYLLSFYKVLFLTSLALPIMGVKLKTDWFEYLNFGGITFLLGYFGEWIQFPLCLLIILLFKTERTLFHFSYLFLLLLLGMVTWLVFGVLLGSLGDM